jgi:hypothetical protein
MTTVGNSGVAVFDMNDALHHVEEHPCDVHGMGVHDVGRALCGRSMCWRGCRGRCKTNIFL